MNNKKKKREYIVYALYCPIKRKPVYVGQSIGGIERPFEHIREKFHSEKVNAWIHELKLDGLNPVITILEWTEHEDLLQEKETFWIQKFCTEGNLLLNLNKVTPIYFDVSEFKEENSDDMFDIAIYIKWKRKSANLTQLELAKKAGVGLRFIRDLEQSRKNNFNTKSIMKVLKLFGAKLIIGK